MFNYNLTLLSISPYIRMPFGTLKASQAAAGIPLCSSPYPVGLDEFSDIEQLVVRYYTTYDAVKDLIPDELELADEPIVTLVLFKYGFSTIGPYTEFVSQVEVKWRGETYQYSIELILDNEGAIFSGRERWGIPKVFGNIVFDPSATKPVPPGFITGHVERPIGSKLVQFSFKPKRRMQKLGPLNRPSPKSLHLRCIPSPNVTDPPAIREFVPLVFEIEEGEVWEGEGSIGLFNVSEFDPLHRLKVVRYHSSFFVRHASAVLHHCKETFPI